MIPDTEQPNQADRELRQRSAHRRGMILTAVGGAFMVAQFVLIFVIGQGRIPALRHAGWALWVFGCVLAWTPIFLFPRRAGVAPGRSFVHTTRLVTTGIYSVVRHPQYLSFFVFALALMLVGQHWLIILLGAIAVAFYVPGLRGEDQLNIEKFGDEYRRYMDQVPGYNVLLGVIRRLTRRGNTGRAA